MQQHGHRQTVGRVAVTAEGRVPWRTGRRADRTDRTSESGVNLLHGRWEHFGTGNTVPRANSVVTQHNKISSLFAYDLLLLHSLVDGCSFPLSSPPRKKRPTLSTQIKGGKMQNEWQWQ